MRATAPTMPASHATATPIQRRRHMACAISRACWSSCSMSRSEPALGDDDHVAGSDVDVRRDVAPLEQVLQPHAVLLAVVLAAHDHGGVAVGEGGEPADLDYYVELRHALPVGDGLRLQNFAHQSV